MTQCLLCLHGLTTPTLPSYHLILFMCITTVVILRWALQEIIEYLSLVQQLYLVGNNNRYGQVFCQTALWESSQSFNVTSRIHRCPQNRMSVARPQQWELFTNSVWVL